MSGSDPFVSVAQSTSTISELVQGFRLTEEAEMKRICRLAVIGPMLVAVLLFTGIASAVATVGTFYDQHVETFQTALPECSPPDLVGTSTVTETTAGHFTETTNGFHAEGSTTFLERVDFPDGRFVLGGGTDHFDFNVTRGGTVTSTSVGQEPRTIYSANGEPIGRVLIHASSHLTFHDANGNGQPDEGEVTSSIDRFFFTCN